jgi:hypothetical protein
VITANSIKATFVHADALTSKDMIHVTDCVFLPAR